MRKLGFTATVLLASIGLAVAAGDARAQYKMEKFKAKDGKSYDYPQWGEIKADKKAHVLNCKGYINLATGVNLTEAKLKVFERGGQIGSWAPTPTITLTVTQTASTQGSIAQPVVVPGTMGMVQKWSIDWGQSPLVDPNTQVIPKDVEVRIDIELKTVSGGSTNTSVYTPFYSTTTPILSP